MKPQSLSRYLKHAFILAACGFSSMSYGDTRSYAATTDFPIIDAGLAPYYSEAPRRLSLAINAANESYRDVFARAEVVYDGNEGVHDVTIVALAELDGEAEYRLLVDGEVVGTASNPEVTVDYTVIRHIFEDVVIPAGAVLGVESLANTNGKIPEGDETAFARGRWTTLELLEATPIDVPEIQVPTDIDLNLTLLTSRLSLSQNEEFQIELTVSNAQTSMTATHPEVSISIPTESLTLVSAEQCSETNTGLNCAFPEIAPGASQSMSLSLMSTDELFSLDVPVFVGADQHDRDEANNMASLLISVNASEAAPEPEPHQPLAPEATPTPDTSPSPNPMSTAASMSNSGGGGLSLFCLLLLLPTILRNRLIS